MRILAVLLLLTFLAVPSGFCGESVVPGHIFRMGLMLGKLEIATANNVPSKKLLRLLYGVRDYSVGCLAMDNGRLDRIIREAESSYDSRRIQNDLLSYIDDLDLHIGKNCECGSDNQATYWKVWRIPYGTGKKCLTKEEAISLMIPGAMADKDGWFKSKEGGAMQPTGEPCTKK